MVTVSDPVSVTCTVHVHKEDGSYWAEIEEYPGAFAAGDTLDELWESVSEAIELYLSTPTSPVTVRSVVEDGVVVEHKFLVCS